MQEIKNTLSDGLPKVILKPSAQKSRVSGLDYTQSQDILNSTHLFVLDYYKKQNKSHLHLFDNSKEGKELFQEAINYAKMQMDKHIVTLTEIIDESTDEEEKEGIVTVYNSLVSVIATWNKPNGLLTNYAEFLKQYKISIDADSILENAGNDENRAKDTAQYIEALKVNHKFLTPQLIKLLTSTLMKIDSNGDIVVNSFGLPQLLPFGVAYQVLINKFANMLPTDSYEAILEKLQEAAEVEPSLKQLYEPYYEAYMDRNDPPTGLPLLRFDKKEDITTDELKTILQFLQTFIKYKEVPSFLQITAKTAAGTVIYPLEKAIDRRLRATWNSNRNRGALNEYRNFYTLDTHNVRIFNVEAFAKLQNIYNDKIQESTKSTVKTLNEGHDFSIVVQLQQQYFTLLIDIFGYTLSPNVLEKALSFENKHFHPLAQQIGTVVDNIVRKSLTNIDDALSALTIKLIKLEAQEGTRYFESSYFNIDGDRQYANTLYSFVTLTANKFEKVLLGKESGEKLFPYFSNYRIGNANSLLINLITRNSFYTDDQIASILNKPLFFKIELNQGLSVPDESSTLSYKDMPDKDREYAYYNNLRDGKYELVRPGDNSKNNYLSVGQPLLRSSAFYETAIKPEVYAKSEVIHLFMNYLKDELARKVDSNNLFSHFRKNHAQQSSMILSDMLEGIPESELRLASKEAPYEYATRIVSTHSKLIAGNFHKMIATESKARFEKLLQLKLIVRTIDAANNEIFIQRNVLSEKERLTKDELFGELAFLIGNEWVGLIEQIKLFYGDIAHYKSVQTSFKRFKAGISTKSLVFSNPVINNIINKTFVRSNNNQHLYDNQGNALIRTAVFNDVEVVSSIALFQTFQLDSENAFIQELFETLSHKYEIKTRGLESIQDLVNNPAAKKEAVSKILAYLSGKDSNTQSTYLKSAPYYKIEEGDGFGYITLDGYKNLLLRSGLWDSDFERLYQWEKQSDIKESDRVFIDPDTKESTPLKKDSWNGKVFNSLKPQYFGAMANVLGFVPTMYKLSVMPILPSVASMFPQLESFNNTLIEQNIDIGAFQSANKGAATRLDENTKDINKMFANANESGVSAFNVTADNTLLTQDTYVEYWGIQLATGETSKSIVTTGTQQMKQVLNNIFDAGEVSARFTDKEKVERLTSDYMLFNSLRLERGRNLLVKKLGLIYKAAGQEYEIGDLTKFVNSLSDSAIERGLPENILEGLRQVLAEKSTIDTLPNRENIENMILGLGYSNAIARKRKGKGAYQVASTMFSKDMFRENYGGKFSSSDLQATYSISKDGKMEITSIEVYLPNFMRDNIDITKVDSRIVSGLIGFRIPTQYVSSIETIKIKGFLPKEAGDIVVVPSEIVAKAGSDFDIDKLFIYLPNTYYNGKKEVYIDYDNLPNQIEELQKNLFGNAVSEVLGKEAYDIVFNGKYVTDNSPITRNQVEILKRAVAENMSVEQFSLFLQKQLQVATEAATIGVESKFEIIDLMPIVDDMRVARDAFEIKAIENKITQLQNELLTLPERATDLVSPIQTVDMKQIASKINSLVDNPYGFDQEAIPASTLLKREFHARLNRTYIDSKTGIGPSALMGTFHILSQLSNLQVLKPLKLTEDNKAQIPVKIKFNVNQSESKTAITLGKQLTADGKYYIADLINQVKYGGADVVNEPWAVDLGLNKRTLNPFLTMLISGINPYEAALLINQPIVKAYLDKLDLNESLYQKAIVSGEKGSQIPSKRIIQDTLKKDYAKSKEVTEVYNASILEEAVTNGTHQLELFEQFLTITRISDILSNAITTVTFDTKGGGKNIPELMNVLVKAQNLCSSNSFINMDKLLFDSFLTPYFKNLVELTQVYKPMFKILQDEGFSGFNGLLMKFINFVNKNTFDLSSSQKEAVVKKFREDYISYKLLVTKLSSLGNRSIADIANSFMTGRNSLAHKIASLQNGAAFENNILLQYLTPIFGISETDKHYIKPELGSLSTEEINQFTLDWEQLFEEPYKDKTVGEYLIYQALLQSGVSYSPMSFIHLAPARKYANILYEVYDTDNVGNVDLKNINLFYRTFWRNNAHTAFLLPKTTLPSRNRFPFKSFRQYLPQFVLNGKVLWDKVAIAAQNGRPIYQNTRSIFYPVVKGNLIKYEPLRDEDGTIKTWEVSNFKEGKSFYYYGSEDAFIFNKLLNKVTYAPEQSLATIGCDYDNIFNRFRNYFELSES